MTENIVGKKIDNKAESEDIFDWDFILDREWLKTKK